MTTIQLTHTQTQVLQYALDHNDGQVVWFPESVKGGARKKVLDGLFNRALVTTDGGTHWYVAAEGYDALGRPRPTVASIAPLAPLVADLEMEATVAQHEAQWANEAQASAPAAPATDLSPDPVKVRTRENSKQATVVQMLKRPEGTTIAQICEATGWQAHTVRGTFAGAFKKKLGLTIESDKVQGGERVYRIA
ncbi:DUF3489 domain-containing protein [Rhodoferax sp. AJA081-3]|uniref:DUF3489 domain-containing protein n=1 Tax=Rhodoferax sp. AJA081-3 TaxID=2752316 RepID=UPI001ADFA2E8|nr:DUF3489 domain-containing protein [Rhodoferax sp. AJA081-3]QTN29641.1 DUF3489 domain-containing protein [Rhodoferax sp. AJA081-3]